MNTKAIEDLQQIKSIMERSTKFLSLSGWSGIWVGICGLAASAILYTWQSNTSAAQVLSYNAVNLILLALITLGVALGGGLYFTIQKTRKQGIPFLTNVTKRLLLRFLFPLVLGGILCIVLYFILNLSSNLRYLLPFYFMG